MQILLFHWTNIAAGQVSENNLLEGLAFTSSGKWIMSQLREKAHTHTTLCITVNSQDFFSWLGMFNGKWSSPSPISFDKSTRTRAPIFTSSLRTMIHLMARFLHLEMARFKDQQLSFYCLQKQSHPSIFSDSSNMEFCVQHSPFILLV